MSYGMQNVLTGDWLMSFDPDWLPEGVGPDPWKPIGLVGWTTDVDEAMRFEATIDGFDLWRTVSTRCPVRYDGRPNRPLTAYTIEMKEIP